MSVYFLEQRNPPLAAALPCWQPWGPHLCTDADDLAAEEEVAEAGGLRRSHSWSGYTSHRASLQSRCMPKLESLGKPSEPPAATALQGSESPLPASDAEPEGKPEEDEHYGEHTTVMLLNLPWNLRMQELTAELDLAGFENAYDFCHFPRNLQTARNIGFAFINFISPQAASCFTRVFHGSRDRFSGKTRKSPSPLRVRLAKIQGFQACMQLVASKKMKKLKSGRFKPVVKPSTRPSSSLSSSFSPPPAPFVPSPSSPSPSPSSSVSFSTAQ